MNRIIILNGPPNCGKDTIGEMLIQQTDAATTQFKEVLYKETAKYFDVNVNWLIGVATSREHKDKTQYRRLDYKTPREALIYVSERICKPKHGNDYFGKIAATNVEFVFGLGIPTCIFTDGGFGEEVIPLLSVAPVIIVQLHGRGTFDGDSRKYINIDVAGATTVRINLIDGQPQKAVDAILLLIKE